jgi:hypothetical protein
MVLFGLKHLKKRVISILKTIHFMMQKILHIGDANFLTTNTMQERHLDD